MTNEEDVRHLRATNRIPGLYSTVKEGLIIMNTLSGDLDLAADGVISDADFLPQPWHALHFPLPQSCINVSSWRE